MILKVKVLTIHLDPLQDFKDSKVIKALRKFREETQQNRLELGLKQLKFEATHLQIEMHPY